MRERKRAEKMNYAVCHSEMFETNDNKMNKPVKLCCSKSWKLLPASGRARDKIQNMRQVDNVVNICAFNVLFFESFFSIAFCSYPSSDSHLL